MSNNTYLLIPRGTVLLAEPKTSSGRQWVAKFDYIAEVWQEIGYSHLWIELVLQRRGPVWVQFDFVGGPEHICYVTGTLVDRRFTRCVVEKAEDAASIFNRLTAVPPLSFDERSRFGVVTAIERNRKER